MIDSHDPEIVLGDGLPLHAQIEEQIQESILFGALHPGEQLPTIRSVAVELGINPGVVQTAYENLEASGWVTTEGSSGVFVSALTNAAPICAHPPPALIPFCLDCIAAARAAGFQLEEMLNTIRLLDQRRIQS